MNHSLIGARGKVFLLDSEPTIKTRSNRISQRMTHSLPIEWMAQKHQRTCMSLLCTKWSKPGTLGVSAFGSVLVGEKKHRNPCGGPAENKTCPFRTTSVGHREPPQDAGERSGGARGVQSAPEPSQGGAMSTKTSSG